MRFQVLLLVRVAAEIEATDQAEAERLAEQLAVRDGSALVLTMNNGPRVAALIDDVEVVDVGEA